MNNRPCIICGENIEAMEGNNPPDEAFAAFRGQWVWLKEYGTLVFMLDQDTDLEVLSLPNGQLAIVSDDQNHPSQHFHKDCLELVLREELGDDEEDDDDEFDFEDDDLADGLIEVHTRR